MAVLWQQHRAEVIREGAVDRFSGLTWRYFQALALRGDK